MKKIKKVIEPFEEEGYATIKELKKDNNTIFVKIEFKEYPLDSKPLINPPPI